MDERVKVGMPVIDLDGKRLGKVSRRDAWGFEVVRGFWSPSEWVIRWDEVLGVDDRQAVRVARSDRALLDLAEGGMPESWRRGTPSVASPAPGSPTGFAPAGGPVPGTTS